MDERKRILWQSLLLTVLIFSVGIIVNHVLDYVRINSILDVMQEHELDRDAYQVEYLFARSADSNTCAAMVKRIKGLKAEILRVGEDLGSYSRFSFFKSKDYDYLKRRYFLLQLQFFNLIQRVNSECGNPYLPILYFYEIDDDESERQGFILQEISGEFADSVVVLSFDIDYDDEPLVDLLAETYNITSAPGVVIDGEVFRGLTDMDVIKKAVIKKLRPADPYGANYDFDWALRASGINASLVKEYLYAIMTNESADPFARGDAALTLGRLNKNDSLICSSLDFFDDVNATTPEQRAIVYETSAALGCGRNKRAFLIAASKEWADAGNMFRSNLLKDLSTGYMPKLVFEEQSLTPSINLTDASGIIIGTTSFEFKNATVSSQLDRTRRDWLGGQLQSPFDSPLLVTFSERLSYNESELLSDIGWHEGARIKELVEHGFSYLPAVGTLVAKQGDRWFAVDDKGVFRFEVPLDKLLYPTTRFLHEDIAVIIDTHGINMLVEQALRNDVDLVVGCCDHPAKVQAAKYLSEHNISVVCLTDKDVYRALGHDVSVLGSPPFTFTDNSVIIGNRPLTILKEDVIVAMDASDGVYALWYYQTPASYFRILEKQGFDVNYVAIDDFNQMDKVISQARMLDATVIAVRVFNKSDYDAVVSFLLDRPQNKAVLFHSASYPYGQKLLREFASQTSFGDPNPVIV